MLDLHCQMILDEYHEKIPIFERMKTQLIEVLNRCMNDHGIIVSGIDGRVKQEQSLVGKLELKGHKYKTLEDITDILGLRVITYYSDEVDKVSAFVERMFEIDWDNSVDKRKMLEIDRFGYMSLHYICRIPTAMFHDENMPEMNTLRFELQIRSLLQHVWANMYHDTGYKSGVEIPPEYLRNMNRLAGLLELADEQFSRLRTEINDYRRKMQSMVASGNLDEVPLNGDTFRSYIEMKPFQPLANKIAAINQAEIYYDSVMPYYEVLRWLGMHTIGDVDRMRIECKEGAYQLALIQLAGTGLDIVAYSVTMQNICIVHVLKMGYGQMGVVKIFEILYGASNYNESRASRIFEQAKKINIV